MRRYLTLCAVLGLVIVAPFVAAEEADDILGLWATDPDGDGGQAHVKIVADGDRYRGNIVWLEEPLYPPDDDNGMAGQPKLDDKNPDVALRKKPIIGLELMQGFVYDGKGTWHKGTIYDPDNGKTYKCKLRLQEDGALKVRGFIGFSMIGRTSIWTRVETED